MAPTLWLFEWALLREDTGGAQAERQPPSDGNEVNGYRVNAQPKGGEEGMLAVAVEVRSRLPPGGVLLSKYGNLRRVVPAAGRRFSAIVESRVSDVTHVVEL